MDYNIGYDKTDPRSIENYSQGMIGKTFRDLIMADRGEVRESKEEYPSDNSAENKRNKGNLGQIVEECFFHYECNSDARADFPEAGVELKVTPYKINKKGSLSAKERLIITMIDYNEVIYERFEESHLWNKARLILLVYYLYKKDTISRLDYTIHFSKLFSPPEQDIKIIKHDYELIIAKIRAGKAHELSEGDTLYLGAAPKAASSSVRRGQPFSDVPAKPRAFSFKTTYMTYILNNYIVPGKTTYEPIVRDGTVDSFEEYVIERISAFRGRSIESLCQEFDLNTAKKPKNLEALLTYRMLGVKGNHAEEFEKANIKIKTIRVGRNNKIKENMSFPAFKFKDIIAEDWEDSAFGNYLRESRFLFVVYKFDENETLRLRGGQFWNMPYQDIEEQVHKVWAKTKDVIANGLEVTIVNGKRRNNLPKASENPVCHVRPHGRNAEDTYELPDGRHYPKQCFWLNNEYIYSQLREELK